MYNATQIIELLKMHKNVLISGSPGTGKSRLLGEVAHQFEIGRPIHRPDAEVPIPPNDKSKVFRSVLHQSSQHRDFMTGIAPDVRQNAKPGKFRIVEGLLYQASEYAKQPGNEALLIIDEINRGPAVQVFGGAIVAIEGDKRLDPDGTPSPTTQYFDLLNPTDGNTVEYAFADRLYLLAAMNQADVSVEPMDVAFLRRWTPVTLEPSTEILRAHLDIPELGEGDIQDNSPTRRQIVEAAVRAFESMNERIALGRGPEFRVGHGMFMGGDQPAGDKLGLLTHLATAWGRVKAHIDEVFFGDARSAAIVLNADRNIGGNPYNLEEVSFGDTPRARIAGPVTVGADEVYGLMQALAANDS